MFSFDGICPHCGSEKGFNAFGVSAYVISDRDYEQFPLTPTEQRIQEAREGMNLPTMRPLKDQQLTFTLAGECRRCTCPFWLPASHWGRTSLKSASASPRQGEQRTVSHAS